MDTFYGTTSCQPEGGSEYWGTCSVWFREGISDIYKSNMSGLFAVMITYIRYYCIKWNMFCDSLCVDSKVTVGHKSNLSYVLS